jgi:hypothetical protein
MGENICKPTFDKGLISNINMNSNNSTARKQTTLLKNEHRV